MTTDPKLPTTPPTFWERRQFGRMGAFFKQTRLHNGDLQAPTLLFRARGGRRILFVGVMHVAESSFYENVQNALDALDGHFAVHFEGVRPFIGPFDEKTDRRASLARAVFKSYRPLSATLGARAQSEALVYRKHWQAADAGFEEVVHAFPALPRTWLDAFVEALTTETSPENHRTQFARRSSKRGRLSLMPLIRLTPWGAAFRKYAIEYRDTVAVDAALHSGRDTALLWGLAHAPRGVAATTDSRVLA